MSYCDFFDGVINYSDCVLIILKFYKIKKISTSLSFLLSLTLDDPYRNDVLWIWFPTKTAPSEKKEQIKPYIFF